MFGRKKAKTAKNATSSNASNAKKSTRSAKACSKSTTNAQNASNCGSRSSRASSSNKTTSRSSASNKKSSTASNKASSTNNTKQFRFVKKFSLKSKPYQGFVFFVFCFLISLSSKNFVLRTAIFEEIIFFFFLTKILHFMLQFLMKLFRCIRSEPLSDKRRSRAGDPRCSIQYFYNCTNSSRVITR